MEAWTEVNLVTTRALDPAVLLDVVDPLVHDELADAVETWFFFWEPELRLRIRWRNPEHADAYRLRLTAALDRAKRARHIRRWHEGAHGKTGATYVGEAAHYGEEAWPRVQKDWMNGSELALTLIRLDRDGKLTRPREYHWQRHVHLVTNQLFASWEDEIELCLRQALGYIKLRGGPTDAAATLIAELHAFKAVRHPGGQSR